MKTELLLPVLCELFAKGAAILLVAALIVRMWRGASAAQRHFVWFAAVAVLLLLPLSRLLNPIWGVPIERPVKVSVPLTPTAAVMMFDDAPNLANVPVPAPVPKRPWAAWAWPGWRVSLVAVWLLGVGACFIYRFAGSWRLRRLEKRSGPLEEERIVAMSRTILRELGIDRPVRLRVSDECRVPMTWGIRQPALMLPREALGWNETRLATALRHEAGHIRRLDYLVRWIAQFACAIHWPNPLVWVAARSLRIAQEQATDDLVLRAGTSPEEYAAQLFDAARTVAAHGLFARQAVSMASPSTLESRVLAIVDERRDRRPLSRLAISLGSLAMVLALGICTAAQLQGADPAPAAASATPDGKAPRQVLIQTKFVEITGEVAPFAQMFSQAKKVFTDPEFQVLVRALNQKKGVDLLSAPSVTTTSKQNAVIEIIREFRHATDWKKDENAGWQPVDFGNKNVGVTLEALPEVKADGTIDLQLKIKSVEFLGFTDLDNPNGKPSGEETAGKRLMPNFSERGVQWAAILHSGETLAFTYQDEAAPKQAGRKGSRRRQVVFVSASIVEPAAAAAQAKEAAAAKPPAKERAESVIIPKIDFRETPLNECVAFLQQESLHRLSEGWDVKLVLHPAPGPQPSITLSLTNVPLLEAAKYVAELAHLPLDIQPDALILGTPTAAAAPVSVISSGGITLGTETRGVTLSGRSAALEKAQATTALKERLDQILIPKIEFREMALSDCIALLQAASVEHSADRKGVNLVLQDAPRPGPAITLTLSNVSLFDALMELTARGKVQFAVMADAVVIHPPVAAVAPGSLPPPPAPAAADDKVGKAPAYGEALVTTEIRGKLEGTIIPKLEFREMTVAAIVDLLNKRARELDPAGKGVEMSVQPGAATDARITLSLSNVPLIEALRYVASLGGLQVVVEPNRVVLQPPAPGAAGIKKAGTGTLILNNSTFTEGVIAGTTTVTNGETLTLNRTATATDRVTAGTALVQGGTGTYTGTTTVTGGTLNVDGGTVRITGDLTPAMPAIEISAESKRMENGVAIVKGKAVLNCAGTTINSDEMTYDALRRRAECRGNVVIKQGSNTITADQLSVEFDAAGKMRVEGDKMKVNTAGEPAVAPYGVWVPGKVGFVVSPHATLSGYVDVRGFKPETEVKCPYTGKTFRVPPLPPGGGEDVKPGPPAPNPLEFNGGNLKIDPAAAGSRAGDN